MPGYGSVETATFEEKAGGSKAKLKVVSFFQIRGDRDEMVDSGMEEGTSDYVSLVADVSYIYDYNYRTGIILSFKIENQNK